MYSRVNGGTGTGIVFTGAFEGAGAAEFAFVGEFMFVAQAAAGKHKHIGKGGG